MRAAEVLIQVEPRYLANHEVSLIDSGEDTDPWNPFSFGDHRYGPRNRHRRLSLSSRRKINVL